MINRNRSLQSTVTIVSSWVVIKSAKRFAHLISLVQSAKNCKCNVQKYFHDNLNHVTVTAEIWPACCPTSGGNQSRFPWFTKESVSNSILSFVPEESQEVLNEI